MYDESQITTLMNAVRETARHPEVMEIREHFAGYWDELGITVVVSPHMQDEAITTIKERIADTLAQHRLPFKWIVMFERNGKMVNVLVPK